MKNIKCKKTNKNWISLCNKKETLLLNDLYCKAIDLIDNSFKEIDTDIVNQYQILDVLNQFIKDKNNNKILETISTFVSNYNKIYDKLVSINEANIIKIKQYQKKKIRKFIEEIVPYIFNKRESILFKKRGSLILNKISVFVNGINDDIIGSYKSILESLHLKMDNITKEYINNQREEEIKERIKQKSNLNIKKEELKKEDFIKIFSYKEMTKLAQNNGYIQSRERGDHLIFKHKDSQKIVVIPAHELQYGLMISIQKQIKENVI